jgi:hypothetical protein
LRLCGFAALRALLSYVAIPTKDNNAADHTAAAFAPPRAPLNLNRRHPHPTRVKATAAVSHHAAHSAYNASISFDQLSFTFLRFTLSVGVSSLSAMVKLRGKILNFLICSTWANSRFISSMCR